MLKKRQGERSLREFATTLGISAPYLSDVYLGKRGLGPAILRKMGLTKTVETAVSYRTS